MPTFTDAQIASVAKSAGFRGDGLTIAVSIAIAESSGRTDVVNSLGCVGLWQIRQSAHPEYSTAQLKDPVTNARAAFKISSGGTDWGAWTTYTSGNSNQFIKRADTAAGKADPSWAAKIPGVQQVADATTAIDSTNALLTLFTSRATWIRVGLVLAGLVAIMWATVKLSATDQNVALVKTVAQLVPEAKLAKLGAVTT